MSLTKLIEAVERARGLLPTYDSAEIQDGAILLWSGGVLVVRVSFDMWFDGAEPHHKEMAVSDLLDLFLARQELRSIDGPIAILRALEQEGR